MSSPAPYQLQEASLRVVVVLVLPHVYRKFLDAFGEQRHLHVRRAGVSFVTGMLCGDGLTLFFGQHLALPPNAPVVSSFDLRAV